MKDAVELQGIMVDTPSGGSEFCLVPSGNHRNRQRVQMEPVGIGAKAPHRCPCCKRGLRAWVQTFPTKEYERWRDAAIESMQLRYESSQFSGPIIACLWVFGGRGFLESRDWDNVQKCVGDAMAAASVLPIPQGLPALKDGKERVGNDDVRSIKGWRTHYLTRAEHLAITGGGAASKADKLQARLFVQLVDSALLDPFKL